MTYSQKLRGLFPHITLHWEDILLLETFQIKYLPDRVAVKEFATLLRSYPLVQRFLVSKYPPISSFLTRILGENKAVDDKQHMEKYCQEALWEIADLILYNKRPELLDTHAPLRWDMDEISSITPLEGKVLADVGAGAGRITFLVAPFAQTVFAVEPVTSFRSYMKEKARERKVSNIHVLDGTLDSIPLPDDSLDILITSNAIGWNLADELVEIERVVKSGGHAIHLVQSNEPVENPFHKILISSPWNYSCLQDGDENMKFRYIKVI